VLLYNLPVVLWGAYVRVSFSGDGCGANWPTCNGQFLPQKMTTPMAIEFTHRLMTGLDTAAVAILLLWAFLAFPKRHAVRRFAIFSFVFLFIEALLGAGLVLFRLVAKDQSAGRVWYLSAHLTNTMLLLAALAATAWLATRGIEHIRLRDMRPPILGALAVTIFVSITGAITALGDTLFPASSLAAGMQQDFAKVSSVLLRLRIIHPLLAVAGAVYILWVTAGLLRRSDKSESMVRACRAVIIVIVVQLAAGMMNLALLAPLPMQLTHLLIADLVWISLVWLALESLLQQKIADPALAERGRIAVC
jgi:heme A synthase